MPCRTRMPTSIGRLTLSAHSREATVKTAIALISTRRPPKRSVNQPLIGMPTAMVTR